MLPTYSLQQLGDVERCKAYGAEHVHGSMTIVLCESACQTLSCNVQTPFAIRTFPLLHLHFAHMHTQKCNLSTSATDIRTPIDVMTNAADP